MPDYVSLANVFIDDILLWDSRMFLGVLGVAGVHAMAGARVWSKNLGLIASIGEDFEQDFQNTLIELGLDLSMLQIAQQKTTRAWQRRSCHYAKLAHTRASETETCLCRRFCRAVSQGPPARGRQVTFPGLRCCEASDGFTGDRS